MRLFFNIKKCYKSYFTLFFLFTAPLSAQDQVGTISVEAPAVTVLGDSIYVDVDVTVMSDSVRDVRIAEAIERIAAEIALNCDCAPPTTFDRVKTAAWFALGIWAVLELRSNARRGRPGQNGTDGSDGRDGVDGADGQDGVGIDGADGADGKDGVDGKDGKDGEDQQHKGY